MKDRKQASERAGEVVVVRANILDQLDRIESKLDWLYWFFATPDPKPLKPWPGDLGRRREHE